MVLKLSYLSSQLLIFDLNFLDVLVKFGLIVTASLFKFIHSSRHFPYQALRDDFRRTLRTFVNLVVTEETSLVASTTSVPTQLLDISAGSLYVSLEFSQLSLPRAAFLFLGAENAKIQYLSLVELVEHGLERLLAERAGMPGSFDPTDARSASLVTAAAEESGISERKQAHGTLERIGRRVHKVAIVSSHEERSASVIGR